MNMQLCILESVDDNYNIRMYGGNSVLFDWLKDRKLADLNLRHLNHHWDVDYINEISAKDYPVKYPIIDFNSDSPNSAMDETNDRAWMGTMLPCIYEHYLIEKCINEAGYSLNNETANSLMFVDNIPAVPLGSKKYERDEDFDRLIGKYAMSPFSGSPTGLLWNANSIIYQNQVYWEASFTSNLSYGGAFCMPDAVKVKVRLIADLQNGVADETVYIDVFSTFNGSYSLVTTYAVLVPIAGQLVDETIELDCKYQVRVLTRCSTVAPCRRVGRVGQARRDGMPTRPAGFPGAAPGAIRWCRGRLVAFFALVSAVAVLDVRWIHHRERAYSGPRQVTTAFIDSYDDGRFGLGRRRLHIIFEVEGRLVRASVRAEDIDGDVPQPGRSTSVEYLVADPLRVRPEGTSRRAQEEADFSRGVAVLCLVLMVLTGAFRVIALLRRRAR